jgi:hypothetical protein
MCFNSRPGIFLTPPLWWHTALLHGHLQINQFGVRQIDQSEICSWRSFAITHGWYIQSQANRQEPWTIEWLRWVGHCTDYILICYAPWFKNGVFNMTRSRTHLLFPWQKHASTAVYPCDTWKMQQKDTEGFITAVHCIDFKQAYDSNPRSKLWDHLRKNQMPTHMLAVHPQKLVICWWIHAVGWG